MMQKIELYPPIERKIQRAARVERRGDKLFCRGCDERIMRVNLIPHEMHGHEIRCERCHAFFGWLGKADELRWYLSELYKTAAATREVLVDCANLIRQFRSHPDANRTLDSIEKLDQNLERVLG